MECRIGCGACCVVLAVPGPFEGYPDGKPAATRCIHLTDDNRCGIWERRPDVCRGFQPTRAYCGGNDAEAFYLLQRMADGRRMVPVALTVLP